MKKTNLALVLVVSFSLLFFSCFRPGYNVEGVTPMASSGAGSGVDDTQSLVFVSLSGGGTRAAAMGWEVLREFMKIPYVFQDTSGKRIESTLADQIDYISGISGGSFAAAAWCLYHDRMDLFRTRFVEKNIEGALLKRLFFPPTHGIKILSPYYDRIHVASEFYDSEVFDRKAFGDLPSRPVLWINATHLALGERFTYEKEYFDHLNSDLASYPIGYACAASSAFPILLSPMTLVNYGAPADLSRDAFYPSKKLNAPHDVEADLYCRGREFLNDKTNRYIHLADGGLVDNQGLQVILDQFDTNRVINKRLNDTEHPLKRLVIISVNAGVAGDDDSDKKESAPGIAPVMEYTMVSSMDILSAKRWIEIKAKCDELKKALIDDGKKTRSLAALENVHTIEISFRNLDDETLKKCNELPTSFKLSQEQLGLIGSAVAELMNKNPDLMKLKDDVKELR